MCDFQGFKAPEMVKRRPVLIVGTKPAGHRLATIVCLSTRKPEHEMPYHMKIDGHHFPDHKFFNGQENWLKGDMIYTVSFDRLDLIRVARKQDGKRAYFQNRLCRDTMKSVYTCVLEGLHIGGLSKHL